MKSQLNDLLKIWEAASFDAASLCATSKTDHERDCARVRIALKTRGLTALLLDLPSLDTLLTTLLEDGRVRFQGPLSARKSKTDLRPRFLWGYWSRVCDELGCLIREPDADAIAAIRQLSCLFKKLEISCSSQRVEDAVREYYEIEGQIVPPLLDWSADSIDLSTRIDFPSSFRYDSSRNLFGGGGYHELELERDFNSFLKRLDKVARILVSELGSFDSMSDDSRETGFFKHGPGAVSNLRGSEYKYSFPDWSDKLEGVFPFDWSTGASLGASPLNRREVPSRLLQVPKTAKSPRLIAAEPVELQWCQQKIKTWLDFAMKKSRIGRFFDPSNQGLSQAMVVQASQDRRLSTLDLSSASDRVSCRHVEALFDSNKTLLEAAHATRTRCVADNTTSRDVIFLKKFATMGSALTFPTQSIFFLCVALASAGASSGREIDKLVGSVRVFGDDIILPTYAYNAAVRNLTALGLKVNQAKSFSKGHFRESCGADYWSGYNVTPVKPKHLSADTDLGIQGLIDTSNNLHSAGYWFAGRAVLDLVPRRFKADMYPMSSSVPGVKSYSGFSPSRIKWDRHLHVWYVPSPTVLKRQERVRQDNSFALREFFTSPHSVERPRETGTKRFTVATIATVRVELKRVLA